MISRGQVYRAVFVQEKTGHVVDAHAHFSLPTRIMETTHQYMMVSGSQRAVARYHVLDFPLLRECDITSLRTMIRQAWPVRCYVVGFNISGVWAVGESLDVLDARRGPATMAGSIATMRSHAFDAAIYQAYNLLDGIPWACTSSTALPGDPSFPDDALGSGSGVVASGSGVVASGSGVVASGSGMVASTEWALLRPGQTGWAGPYWDPQADGTSVDYQGQLTTNGFNPLLSMVLPLEGSTLLFSGDGVAGTVKFYDWSGNLLSGTITKTAAADASGQVPTGTWRVDVEVSAADAQPILAISNPGARLDPRPGIFVGDDGVQSGIPSWSS